MSEETQDLVLDIGSGYVKAGVAGDDSPKIVFPNVIARPKSGSESEFYVGQTVEELVTKETMTIKHPVEQGIVRDWDSWGKVLSYTFYNALCVSPEDRMVLITETPLNPIANRERTAEIMFEQFRPSGLYFGIQALMAMYSIGRTSGLVVESGEGVTHCVPVYEGYTLPHAIRRLDLAGGDVTSYLAKLLAPKIKLSTTSQRQIVKDIKEKVAYVALDYDAEVKAEGVLPPNIYTLPDGSSIEVSDERYKCTEALFEPMLLGIEAEGIPQMIYNSIQKMDLDLRRDMYTNILFSGGNTLLEGLEERVLKEMKELVPPAVRPRIVAPMARKHAAWLGGSILMSLTNYTHAGLAILRREYEEEGLSVVHRKSLTVTK